MHDCMYVFYMREITTEDHLVSQRTECSFIKSHYRNHATLVYALFLLNKPWWIFLWNFSLSKTLAKCNLGFFCECTQVKPLCKSRIMTKEALLRFAVFSFLGQTHFQWVCHGHFSNSTKIAVFKILRRLDITSKALRALRTLCSLSLLKRQFLDNSH